MWLIVLILALIILYIIIRPYFLHYDNLVSFTGGLGSGKTFMSVQTALVLYRKQLLRWKLRNFYKRRSKRELRPELYSNIPLKISGKRMAIRLTKEHLLLQKRITPGSVCLLDEVDCFANQFSYNNPCIVDQTGKGGDDVGNFDEFCRFYRHYTRGGYLIFNTQATANENLTIRRRQNQINILFNFKKWGIPLIWPNIIYTVKVRNVIVSDDVKAVEEGNTEDNMRIMIGFFPFTRHYDTYCYSGRYEGVPYGEEKRFPKLKTNETLTAPRGKQPKLTLTTDDVTAAAPALPAEEGNQNDLDVGNK